MSTLSRTHPSISHHRADVNGIRLYYLAAGSGDPLVLLHGFPETSYAWRKVIPSLAEHFRVIAPDLRGCGASDRPDHGYDKRTVAEDVHQLVEQLGLGPINLVGHDVGMMVAYAYAASFRNEVKKLALMEAALPGLGLEELYDAVRFPRMYHLPLFEAPNALAEQLIAGRERMFVEHFMLQQAYDTTGPEDDALQEYSRWLAAPGALHGGISYFRSHWTDAERNREHAKTKLAMPVLTVAGSASAGTELAPWIEPLVEQLQSVVIDDCGHYLAEERPARVSEEFLAFFTEEPRS